MKKIISILLSAVLILSMTVSVFAESEKEWNLRKFNIELKKLLPPYMMPGKLVLLEKMPHTPNGKIDRVTLKKLLSEE